ncbi:MAG: hypothetical protein LBU90_01560 [Bacteroidales bacterium]|jgi:hypothetical protein|nr:hypothetical protein [Bacteroidales bacterium]
MKQTAIFLSLLAVFASACNQATKHNSDDRFLITVQGVDIFVVGQSLPTQTGNYAITKTIETRPGEGEAYQVAVYAVSENKQNVLKIETPYDSERNSNKKNTTFAE